MIGLPLRLLAREIYDRMVREKGPRACALITGEECIRPEGARYFACTVEAMPVNEPTEFLAVDEIQLAADPERGHVFTDRLMRARGRGETMLLGADTMRDVLAALDLDVDSERRRRFSKLSYAGPIKITKLPKRSAVVAFSAEDVYEIAELLRRQRGGCAVIMGALSPRTRNAQVELYQSGEVDYIVATDAIGMGLNMDVGHVAFASRRKFDGRRRRLLRADEIAQIAGRAGRFTVDGGFGETADCEPFDDDDVRRIEEHTFAPVEGLVWRSADLDFSSLEALTATLRQPPVHPVLRRTQDALDEQVLAALTRDADVRSRVRSAGHVRRLWDLCSLPDFRKAGIDGHLRLVASLHERLADPAGRLRDEWLYEQVARLDRTEGDIDVLQQRLANVRVWTYAANRPDWVENAGTWRGRTREIEDRLSDALHERLMLRFVDRRTSALLKSLSSEIDAAASIDSAGRVTLEGHPVGRLDGLVFRPDPTAEALEGRALRNAAMRSLRPVIEARLMRLARGEDDAFGFTGARGVSHAGWAGDEGGGPTPVARLTTGADWLSPGVDLVGADDAPPALRAAAVERIANWLKRRLEHDLAPLFRLRDLLSGGDLSGPARGLAHLLTEAGAAIDLRGSALATDLTGGDRQALRMAGVRVGRNAAWATGLLKPGPATLALRLRALQLGIDAAPDTPRSGSFPLSGDRGAGWSPAFLLTAGYLRLGPRAVRADMAERLGRDLAKLRRAAGRGAFAVPPEIAATIGCPAAELADVLKGFGLTCAERSDAGAAVLWRFRSARKSVREDAPPPRDTPFAALAVLTRRTTEPQADARGEPPPRPGRNRRRSRNRKAGGVALEATARDVQTDEA
ncbi:helicase [bacterium]|nr:helicase [bacterium]